MGAKKPKKKKKKKKKAKKKKKKKKKKKARLGPNGKRAKDHPRPGVQGALGLHQEEGHQQGPHRRQDRWPLERRLDVQDDGRGEQAHQVSGCVFFPVNSSRGNGALRPAVIAHEGFGWRHPQGAWRAAPRGGV